MPVRLLKYCGELILVGIFCFILCEVIMRIWGYSDIYMYDPIYEPFSQSDQLPYIIKPDLKNARGPGITIFNTNEIGLRSFTSGEKIGPKSPGDFRIAVLGDSVTFGQGVPTEDSFSVVTAKALNAAGARKVESYNYGVMAYSILEMEATLEHRVMDIQPDLVLLCVIYDDFNLNRRCRLDKWGYLSGALKDTWLTNSIIKKWLRHIHLIYFLRDLTGDPTTHHDPLIKNFPDAYRASMKKFVQVTSKNATRFLVVLLPDTHPFNEKGLGLMAGLLEEENIEYLDLAYLRDEFSLDRFTCHSNDPHPSVEVHRRIGKEIAEYLSSHPGQAALR